MLRTAEKLPLLTRDPKKRIGLVALATDLTLEGDLAVMLPDEVQLHVTRVAFVNPTTPENLRAMGPRLREAAALILPDRPLLAIGFGCTSGSAVIGEDVVQAALTADQPGRPVVTPTSALTAACTTLGVARLAVLTPYLPEATTALIDHLNRTGPKIVAATCLGYEDDRDMARVEPEALIAAAVAADHVDAQALFLSCTALNALDVIEEIEARIGKPVMSSNQVMGWALMRAAGVTPRRGVGRLFREAGAPALTE